MGGLGTFSWTALLPHPCCQFCFQHICLNHGGLREHALSPLCSFGHGDRSSGRNDFCYQDVDTPPPTPSHAQYSRNPQIKKYYKTQHNISIIPNIGHALSGYMQTMLVVLFLTVKTLPVLVVLLLPLLRLHVLVGYRLTESVVLCLQDKLFPDPLQKMCLNVWENSYNRQKKHTVSEILTLFISAL